ncbi:acyltransferase [Burkholderia sp. Ac-20349]|uniref:acyltransferase family protein n=1 Tax=Burkholderia sp. Ac-20349 TaxID=2703893 RepID=UPI00197BEB46|nr:acyltransferase [Burkholderia sp. Ac-20349]MBN3840383.1 acyltransferase [Burkholderia sp. Ac-20349]
MAQKNNFDFVRIVAALAVLVSHARPIHDATYPLGDLGAAAVFAFFAVSGYLVSASWERDPHPFRFLLRRALRIVPGFFCAILLAACVVGPMLTTLPGAGYLTDPRFALYLRSLLLYPMGFVLPGVFEHNPLANNVNGSLWTLPLEATMYFGLCALGRALYFVRRATVPVLVALLAAGCWLEIHPPSGNVCMMNAHELVRAGTSFATGALLWHLRKRIPLFSWAWLPVAAAIIMTRGSAVEIWLLMLAIPYAVISFAVTETPYLSRIGALGDPSYGIYVYAFLIQQTLMALFPHIEFGPFVLASIILSVASGYMSWHIIEKPALRLKNFAAQPNTASGNKTNRSASAG